MATQVWTSRGIPLSLLLLIIAATTITTTEGVPTCKTGCQGKPTLHPFNYETGHTYVYNFDGHTLMTLPGAQGEGNKLHIKATAEISFLGDCKNILKLKDVVVTGPDSKKYNQLEELEAHPVVFSFENGIVDRELCTEPEDTEASLNIKRAVLSLLQVASAESSNLRHGPVLDIFGYCPTDFTVSEYGGATTITKLRNLNKCHHREHLVQDFTSIAYETDSELPSTPLMEATQKARTELKNGLVTLAESTEQYLYRPFSNQEAGAKTVVNSKLTLATHAAGAAPATGANLPRSLMFEPPHLGNTKSSSSADIIEALQKAHNTMPEHVGIDSPQEVSNLVRILRYSSKEDILSVYGQVKAGAGFKNKKAVKKLFLDALFRTGTGDAVEVAVELLKNKEITGAMAHLYYMQLAYIKHVSLSALNAAVSLLESPDVPKIAYLGVGSLGGRYCSAHICDNVPEFDAFLNQLASHLGNGKPNSWDEELTVVATLKALHNVHHLSDAVAEKVKNIALDDSLATRVRVAALETFQSDACRLKDASLEVLKNIQLDSEIRIKAFLALVSCPCPQMSNKLKEILDHEPTYQVGSFIVSYLRNLRASTNPDKAKQKLVYGQIRTTKRFPEDFRKFSHNYELSYLLGGANVGTSIDSNVIYSQKSFLPRSSFVNVTTEVFGHSFNLLEWDVRQENLDRMIEKLFGPSGYLKTHNFNEVLKSGKDTINMLESKIKQRMEHSLRGRRSVSPDQLEEIRHNTVGPYHTEHRHGLILDMSLKLYGSELGWYSIQRDFEMTPGKMIDQGFDLLDEVIAKAKDFNMKHREHRTFMDSELVYPTAAGLPLKLVASGSAAVHVDFEGNVDIKKLYKNFKNSDVHFKVVPSGAVQVVGEFVVDGYAVESGMKLATTLHTSTGVDVTLKATDGVGVDVMVGLPVKKQDVLTLQSEVLSTIKERGKGSHDTPVIFNTPRKDYHGCFDPLKSLLGITFCGEVSFPWDPVAAKAAFYPLNGNSKVSLSIENEDVTSYHFRAAVNKDANKKSLELLFDTPNSQMNRKLMLLVEHTVAPHQGLKAQLTSPWKTVSGEVIFIDNDHELSLEGKVHNDDQEYLVKIGAEVSGDATHATYTPLLEYKTPDQAGSLVSRKQGKGKPGKAVHGYGIQGSITVDKSGDSRKYTFNDIVLTTPHGEFKGYGTVEHIPGVSYGSDLKVEYGGNNHVTLQSKLEKISPNHYKTKVHLLHSEFPDLGINLDWEFVRSSTDFKNDLVLVHGADPNNDITRLSMHQEYHVHWNDRHDFEISAVNKVTYPLLNIVGEFVGKVTPKLLYGEVEVGYEKYKFETELEAKTHIVQEGDYEVEFKMKAMSNSIEFTTKREIMGPEKSKFTTVLVVTPGGTYELIADVTHVSQKNNIDFQVDAVAKLHGQPHDYKLDTGLIVNPHVFDSHAKVIFGDTEYIDFLAKFNKASGNPSGTAKLHVKNYLDSSAQFKYAAGKGSATLNIDIPKLGRKIKGTGDLDVDGSRHVATVDLYYNADKNPNQKIHFHTDSDIKTDAIDSKNTFSILDYTTTFNVKGTLVGKVEDGQIVGEFDMTLPNNYHFTGKMDRTMHVHPTNSEGDVKLELTAAKSVSSPPAKVTFELAAKNVDTKMYSFDGQAKLAYSMPDGRDGTVFVAGKNIPQREQRVIEGQMVVQSSCIAEPLRMEFSSEVYVPYVTYKAHGSYGTSAVVDVAGKVTRGLKYSPELGLLLGPFGLDNTLEIRIPLEKVKYIKLVSALSGEAHENKFLFKSSDSLNVDAKVYKLEIDSENEVEKGSNKIQITLPNDQPRSYSSDWYFHYNDYKTNEVLKYGGSVAAQWAGSKEAKLAFDVDGKKDLSEYSIHATAQTPIEKLKTIELNLKNKYTPAPKLEVDTDVTLVVEDKTYKITNKLTPGIIDGLPNIDFTAIHPGGKTRVYLFLQSKSKNEVSGNAELEWAAKGGGKLIASGKANLESAQNFKIELDVDSEALKVDKWHVLLANKPAKGAKSLVLSATSAGAPVVSGRLEYHLEDKENSYKAGVSGQVKVRDQPQPLKAEISFVRYTPSVDGELGFEAALLFHLGEKKFDAVSKYTNKEGKASVSLCPAASECSVAEAFYIFKVAELTKTDHVFGAKVDLKATGLADGFVLEGKTIRNPTTFDHNAVLTLLNEKQTRYSLHAYASPKELGVVFDLPQQRVVALEGKIIRKEDKGQNGVDLSFWLDKTRQPDQKAGLHLLTQFNPSIDGTAVLGEAKFSHPALGKDLAVIAKGTLMKDDVLLDGTIDFDLFLKKNQKIIVTAKAIRNNVEKGCNVTGYMEIKSKGQGLDIVMDNSAEVTTEGLQYQSRLTYKDEKQKHKEALILLHLSLTELLVYVKSPVAELLRIERHLTSSDGGVYAVKGEAFVAGMDPVLVTGQVDFPKNSHHIFYKKSTPDKKLDVFLQHDIMKGFDVRLTSVHGDSKNDLLWAGVSLTDEEFLKTKFIWSSEELKNILESIKRDGVVFIKQIKVIAQDFGKEISNELQDLVETLKKAQPNLKPIVSSYQNQLKALKDELLNDEGFKEASEYMKKVVGGLTKTIVEISEKITEIADHVLEIMNKIKETSDEAFKKYVPKVTEFYTKVVDVVATYTSIVLDEGSKILIKLAAILKEHDEDIRKLVTIVRDVIEDFGRIVSKSLVEIRKEAMDFIMSIVEQLKAMPIYATIKERYEFIMSQTSEYVLPEEFWSISQELVSGILESMPTQELQDLVNALEAYIKKHINKEKVNEVAELQVISNKAIIALKSLVKLVRDHIPEGDSPSFLGIRIPFKMSTIADFPKDVVLKLSPLAYILSGDLPSLEELIYTYRPTLNPLDWIPPFKAHGVLIDLHHFITLDGRHFTFHGTCAYVLLQDTVDGNFSVAIDYNRKSIVVSDHDQEYLEFFYDGKFAANGQPAEFPYTEGKHLVAWREYNSVNVMSSKGLYIKCDTEHDYCFFYVSGFYFGKTRGLLGAMDYEPWDDFKKPNGEVVKDVNDFGNSWKIGACGDVSGEGHHGHGGPEPSECASKFSGNSNMRLAFPLIRPTPYRDACRDIVEDESTPEAKNEAACSVAAAYVAAARDEWIPVSLPNECMHCKDINGQQVKVGEVESVKIPQKAADVVIVVEQHTANEELFKDLITPLVTTLSNDLKAKGINDVHFSLIGFGEDTHWYPALYTSNGKIVFDGKTQNIKFTTPEDPFGLPMDSMENRIKYLKAFLEAELGLSPSSKAYQFASRYPFKIGTAKVLIGLVANPKTSPFALTLQHLHALYATKVLRDRGVSFHLVAPVEDLKLKDKDAKAIKQIVGFDDEHVYTLRDKKKKGSSELYEALSYKNNVWIPISLNSHGATYVAQNFVEAKSEARKQFLQVFSHRIAQSVEGELYADCKCVVEGGLHPFSECKVTGRKEREREELKGAIKGVKG